MPVWSSSWGLGLVDSAGSTAVTRRLAPEGPTRRFRRAGAFGLLTGALVLLAVLPWVVPAIPRSLTNAFAPAAAPSGQVTVEAVDEAAGRIAADAYASLLAALHPLPPTYLEGRLASSGPPVRVRVPRLDVDARVLPISGQGGELVPPVDPQVLGWWQEGRRVGAAAGAAVITGHTVHTGGGALDELGTLRRGDTFTVVTEAGAIVYLVRWQHDYPTSELAARAHRLFGQGDFHRLLLVTCSGWNGHGYDNSSVVLARPVFARVRNEGPR